MNINIITHYYPPETGAPQARLSEMAKAWQKEGHDVTVLTGFPNHPTGIIPEEYRGQIFKEETRDNIKVWRHWVYATPNKGVLKKTLGHLSFMFTCVILSLFRGRRPDMIIVSSPTFFSVISAFVFSIVRRVPFIFEVRDLWPGIFIELNILKNKLIIRVLEAIELFLYRRAKYVIVVSHGFKQNISDRGIDPEKIFVITNGADLKRFGLGEKQSDYRKKSGIGDDKFLVLYAGAHGISHGLESILDAAKILQEKDETIHFLFAGDGAEKSKLIQKRDSEKIRNVSFTDSVPKDEMAELYRSSDICLVPLRNIEGFKTFIPSKMFEIMACGKPILGALEGEAAEILERSKGAVVVPPEQSDLIARKILELKSNPSRLKVMGKNAYDFVSENYDREKLALKYLTIILQ